MRNKPILPDEETASPPSLPTMHGGDPNTFGHIDHYDLLRKLGVGGFGVVYLARDTVSGIEVAIKTLDPRLSRDLEEIESIRENFVLVSRLAHPNIATALVLHRVRDFRFLDKTVRRELRLVPGDYIMVMRYAPGVTLSRWRRQFRRGVVPLEKTLEIGRQIASALDYAHEEGIVHRDIKPSNIMVETLPDGRVRARILDFGIAAEIRLSMSRVSTEKEDTSGTPPYMAPEQWQGKKQNGRTDQYALACVLYELLSGAPPFASVFSTSDPRIQMVTVLSQKPETVDNLDPNQNKALLRALSKTPGKRFDSCLDLIRELGAKPAESVHRAENTPKTQEISETWFQRGLSFLNGQGVPLDSEEAVKWFRKAAELGNANAQFHLGKCYANREGIELDQVKAGEWYGKAAEQGHADAQHNLAWCYHNGFGVPKNEEEAAKWYHKAAEQGHADAQYHLGEMYFEGEGVLENDNEAVKWFRKAAKQGDVDAQRNLGEMYTQGLGVARNEKEAAKWFIKAAEQGDADAQYFVGQMFYEGRNVEQSNEEATKWFRKAAEQGVSRAQEVLASLSFSGSGVAQSYEIAAKWRRMAAEDGDVMAQRNLGLMYEEGLGVAQSYEEAVKWYRKAAEQGNVLAQECLGQMYEEGRGVEQSNETAAKWFRKAAEQGDVFAQFNLGWMYFDGRGVAQSDKEAAKWFRKAAERGDVDSQYNLAWLLEQGRGVEKNNEEAIKWYQKAAEQGDNDAVSALRRLGVLIELINQ